MELINKLKFWKRKAKIKLYGFILYIGTRPHALLALLGLSGGEE